MDGVTILNSVLIHLENRLSSGSIERVDWKLSVRVVRRLRDELTDDLKVRALEEKWKQGVDDTRKYKKLPTTFRIGEEYNESPFRGLDTGDPDPPDTIRCSFCKSVVGHHNVTEQKVPGKVKTQQVLKTVEGLTVFETVVAHTQRLVRACPRCVDQLKAHVSSNISTYHSKTQFPTTE